MEELCAKYRDMKAAHAQQTRLLEKEITRLKAELQHSQAMQSLQTLRDNPKPYVSVSPKPALSEKEKTIMGLQRLVRDLKADLSATTQSPHTVKEPVLLVLEGK